MLQLSQAIILGDSLKKHSPWMWLSADGSCGCAFGGALLAAGLAEGFIADARAAGSSPEAFSPDESQTVVQVWPWLTPRHLMEITALYINVNQGVKTIEDVAAYVRSVEPEEPTPAQVQDVCELLEVGR
jgi:hypothetical protein